MGSDLGAWRTARALSRRLGMRVHAETVEELAARGLIQPAAVFKGCQLYCQACADTMVTPADAEAAQAAVLAAKPELNRMEAAAWLGIRQSDFDLLVDAGLIIPDRLRAWKWGDVRLFTRPSLDEFAARPDVDLDAARATPRGRRTPLYALAEPYLVLRALGGPPPPRVRQASD